jgi:alkaline phosphatase
MRGVTRNKLILFLLAGPVAAWVYFYAGLFNPSHGQAALAPAPKYIFIFMADGAGLAHLEITRQYNKVVHNEGLIISDRIMKEGSVGLITTHAADSLSTDSAAAATAMASGCKTQNGRIGICEDGTIPKTVLEVAKAAGMRIGLVTNATVYDASPAALASHVPNRRLFGQILDQYLSLGPDLLMGGGRDWFLPKSEPGSRRKDDTSLIESFKKRGYTYASNKKELGEAKGSKLLGLFGLRDMSFEIDRDKEVEPSVSDMTQAAIRILQEGNRRGFVVFIENEHIDTASHLTDIASVVRDFRELDKAVGLAYEFYKKHPRETLILVASDHETGGLGFTLALKELDAGKDAVRLFATTKDLEKIHSIPISLKRAVEILGPQPTADSIDQLMKTYFKGFRMPADHKEMILNRRPHDRHLFYPVANCLGMMIANNVQAYWGSAAHTNQPVFVAALGVGAAKFRGYQDNTDFAKHLFALIGEKK